MFSDNNIITSVIKNNKDLFECVYNFDVFKSYDNY